MNSFISTLFLACTLASAMAQFGGFGAGSFGASGFDGGVSGGFGFGAGEGHSQGFQDHHHYPKYKFEYGVKDPHTGDHKEAYEHRDGDHTKGGYSLYEPDGTKRVVEYHSDGKSGFQAIVKRIGHAHHPAHYGHSGSGFGGSGSHGKGGVSYQNNNLYH